MRHLKQPIVSWKNSCNFLKQSWSIIPHYPNLLYFFLKLGFVAFGGPTSHIAMVYEEVVVRRKWLSRQQFLDLVGATNLIPGPNSTEIVIHIGYVMCGWHGLLLAGISFILPASLITVGYAWAYMTYGTLPEVKPWLVGISPAVIAIIASAVFRLGHISIQNRNLLVLSLVIIVAVLLGVGEIIALLVGGLLGMIWIRYADKLKNTSGLIILILVSCLSTITVHGANSSSKSTASLWKLAIYFMQIGSVLFGSSYVLFAFLEGGLVDHHEWITHQQLVNAVVAGQITPGPVLRHCCFHWIHRTLLERCTSSHYLYLSPILHFRYTAQPINSENAEKYLDGLFPRCC